MGQLDGTVALISGGARGMGAAEAALFVAEGARVVVGDVLDEQNLATAAALGDACQAVHLDVTSVDDWRAAVEATESWFGPITALVNNAGVAEAAPIEQTDVETFRRVLDINLTGSFLGIQATIPSLRRSGGGCIVNISSTAGLAGYPFLSSYVASKWGVRGLTKVAALELARENIRVNSVHPAPIDTPMTAAWDEASITGHQPIPRFGTPDEVAQMVLFIVAQATYSTGSEFVVDGGLTTGMLPRARRSP
jgi:3alpha(or 20beta)-hydroxysteroid dehydrogenase